MAKRQKCSLHHKHIEFDIKAVFHTYFKVFYYFENTRFTIGFAERGLGCIVACTAQWMWLLTEFGAFFIDDSRA